VILFCTVLVEKSASVALVARWLMMTGFRASGDMVATYWSVLVTVVIAHVESTDIGISNEASTTKIHAMTPRDRRARGPRVGASADAGAAPSGGADAPASAMDTPDLHQTLLNA
jgi:hypothetical protein